MLVQLDRMKKEYDGFSLELNMEIPENQVTGLIGANGAGKSTTFKLMLGLIRPDEGNVEIFGRNAAEMGAEDKQKIGAAFFDSGFSEYLKVQQLIPIMSRFYPDFQEEEFRGRCERFKIPLNKQIKEFSTGMKAADAGYYGAVWDETRPVDVSRMITEEEWKLNKSGKNKKIANGGDVLSNEKYEKPGNEKILEEKTSQRKYENIEEQETSEQSKNTDAVRKSKSNPNVPEERNSQNANSDLPPKTTKDIIYKITRQEIAGLPRKEWKLANNHFLLHGYYNYHHLVSFEKEGKCWIGVPGLYFPGEQRAAGAFGFSQFMKPSDGELDLEEYEIEDEEHFGYWCRPVGAVIRKEVKEKEDAADIDRRRKIHEGSDPSGEKSMED